MGIKRDWQKVKGYVKGAMDTGAGLIDLANMPFYPIEGEHPDVAIPAIKHFTDSIRNRARPSNQEQENAKFTESMAEFLPLGPEEGAESVARYAAKADISKFAKNYPIIAAAVNTLKHVARGAIEQGGQTWLKTEDPEASLESAKVGGVTSGVVGGIAEGYDALGKKADSLRPGTRTVAGADFATQPGTAKPVLRNTEDVLQDPATQSVDEALGNIGKTGVANSVNRTNAMRAPEGEIIPPPRRLPGRAGFTMRTTPPEFVGEQPQTGTETVENGTQTVPNPDYEAPAGELAPPVPGQSAEATAGEIGEPLTAATPERTFTGPERGDTRNATQRRIDAARGLVPDRMLTPPETVEQPVYQQQPTTTQPTESVITHPARESVTQPNPERVGGGGTYIITEDGQAMSPERARQRVAQYDRILNDPDEVEQMGVRAHQAVRAQREDLAGQLGRYDNFAASQPHFPLHDAVEMQRATDSIGDAGAQLKAAHGPFWDAADQASGGEFTNLRDEEKRLEKQIYGPNPTGRLDDLRQQLAENQQKQMDFFDKYKTTVNPQDWERARSGYQDGIVLSNFDNMLQRKFGGISRELEQRGIASGNKRQRVFQPGKDFSQELTDFYNDGFRGSATNGEVLQRTIGQKHMDAVHDLGIMFNSTERMQQSQGLIKTVLTSVLHHYHGVRGMLAYGGGAAMLGATLGAREAGIAGVPLLTGTSAGIKRYITERLITDPEFGKSFTYAIKNGVPPRTAGPLLAARIIASWHNNDKPQPTGAK